MGIKKIIVRIFQCELSGYLDALRIKSMETTKQDLAILIAKVKEAIPDGNDLKGFAGISSELILNVLDQSDVMLVGLTEHNNDFETIILKRELSELFGKISEDLSGSFDKMKSNDFNGFLKRITKIKFLIKETFLSVTERLPIRTEAAIAKAKEDLQIMSSDIQKLTKIASEVDDLSTKTTKNFALADVDIAALKASTTLTITSFQNEVSTLKDKTVVDISASFEEIKKIKDSVALILIDFEAKQKKFLESEQKVDALLIKIEGYRTSIEMINKNATAWDLQIKKANEEIAASSISYNGLVKKFTDSQNSIEDGYRRIFGSKNVNGEPIKGYLDETEDLKNSLLKFYTDQEQKYTAQYNQIEGLLPGATSAGLAEAFEKQKNSYTKQIQLWSWVFIGITLIMTVFSVYILFPGLFHIQATTILTSQNLGQGLMSLLKDLPFFIPTIWLAVFASKQQSQFKRLQQEYAFKETNAKSFYGYKKQIEELGKGGEAEKELLYRLIGQLVIITAENPSRTLDNSSHNDSPPILKVFEKMFPGKAKETEVEKIAETKAV